MSLETTSTASPPATMFSVFSQWIASVLEPVKTWSRKAQMTVAATLAIGVLALGAWYVFAGHEKSKPAAAPAFATLAEVDKRIAISVDAERKSTTSLVANASVNTKLDVMEFLTRQAPGRDEVSALKTELANVAARLKTLEDAKAKTFESRFGLGRPRK